jgi:dipeptidyl aminopeptidase/acylaminoacyl peptidase
MKVSVPIKIAVLLYVVLLGHPGYTASQDTAKANIRSKRPVTTADAIRMTKFADPEYSSGASSRGLVAQFSPDGKKFVVVLRKGDPENNTNVYSMLLWRTQEVFSSPNMDVLLTMSSSSNRAAIHDVKWLQDNETVAFLGENPEEPGQLYTLNIKTHALNKISKTPDNLLAYCVTVNGDQVAYIAQGSAENLWNERARREGVHIFTQPLYKLLVGEQGNDVGGERRLFFQSKVGNSRRLYTEDKIEYGNGKNEPLLSPDGKYILLLLNPSKFPAKWKEYTDPNLQNAMSGNRSPGQTTWVTRYELIDTGTGERRPLLNVPVESWNTEAAWAPDSHSVVIANSYLPLDNINGVELNARKCKKFAVEVKVTSGEITPITQDDLKLLSWDATTNELLFEVGRQHEKGDAGPKAFFRRVDKKWEKVKSIAQGASRPEIILEEDMNNPPKLFAVDTSAQRRALLLDLNPQFNELKFGKVEEIAWKNSDGVEIRGGLYYPVDYSPEKKYPLVIQTHGWTPDKFWIDGPWTTAYAAQALAGKNIMVLQAEKWSVEVAWWSKVTNTPKEVEGELAAYERAIDYLDGKGLIDRDRVGIVGFSRTCMYVEYTLTHSNYHFAAASVTDGTDAGYLQYITNVTDFRDYALEMEGINGGVPFGRGLKSWMERSPGFNLDKVQTPVRITAITPVSAFFAWEWFAGLTRLGKPVDMVMIQDGAHLLEKPWERMISQQGNVDWFCFWLNGEEDPDPGKAEQYTRWRELRKQQGTN